jgi:ATP:ADP antiporter, AAA family
MSLLSRVDPRDERSLLDRLLSIVSDVRPGEGRTALLLAANVFCLLASYYVLKTVREALILSEGGAEVKSYSAAGQAFLLLLLVPLYGAFASRVDRVKLVGSVTLFFVSHLLVFYALGVAGLRVGTAFFLWVGIFNLVVIAQFWAFANDIFSGERGKRLFPIVGLGSSLGAWIGAHLASVLFAAAGPYRLLLLAAAGLAASLALTFRVHRREQAAADMVSRKRMEEPLGKKGSFQLVIQERYLLLIALLVVAVNVVNSVGEFLLGKLVVDQAAAVAAAGGPPMETYIGRFYGSFFAWVNLLGFLFQALLVSRVFRYIGVRGALFILPFIALASYSTLAFLPLLGVVRIAKTLENSVDYSLQNTARHALFLQTSREAKYKAKQAIDSFFWRAGDLLQAGVVLSGVRLAFHTRHYAMLNLLFVGVWLAIVAAVHREHRRLTPVSAEKEAAA